MPVRLRQVGGGADAGCFQAGAQAPAHTPDVPDGHVADGAHQFRPAQAGQVADPLQARQGFGQVIGQFGQGLGGADADAGGDADPAQHALADSRADVAARAGQAGQVQEAFIDGIDFLGG